MARTTYILEQFSELLYSYPRFIPLPKGKSQRTNDLYHPLTVLKDSLDKYGCELSEENKHAIFSSLVCHYLNQATQSQRQAIWSGTLINREHIFSRYFRTRILSNKKLAELTGLQESTIKSEVSRGRRAAESDIRVLLSRKIGNRSVFTKYSIKDAVNAAAQKEDQDVLDILQNFLREERMRLKTYKDKYDMDLFDFGDFIDYIPTSIEKVRKDREKATKRAKKHRTKTILNKR